MPVLPEITEVKETLAGARHTFRCGVIARRPGEVVVLFVSVAPRRVENVDLPAGTVTFGYFWTARPYNVYHWMSPAGVTLGLYVNIADGTDIAESVLSWRDLAVDLLVWPEGNVTVLDEHELPAGLDPALAARIQEATRAVVAAVPALRAELEESSTALWPRVFGTPRRP
jgi:predicted RNA-binding protein associated with RNAse of E/G family